MSGASSKYNNAEIGDGSAGGTGATQVNANHILQYPRQPRPDDGKWMALGSVIGTVVGIFASGSLIDKAKSAENTWKSINDDLYGKGKELWANAPAEKALADEADAALKALSDWDTGQRDEQDARADRIDPCVQNSFAKLCEFVNCGYKPDYDGIARRVQADAAIATEKQRAELCKTVNRYALRQCCAVETNLAQARVSAIVGNTSKLREEERVNQYKINESLYFKAAELTDRVYNGRMQMAMNLNNSAQGIQTARYSGHIGNYLAYIKAGGDFLASAGQNFAWLADSYRKTAEKDTNELATLAAILVGLYTAFMLTDNPENDKDCA